MKLAVPKTRNTENGKFLRKNKSWNRIFLQKSLVKHGKIKHGNSVWKIKKIIKK
jgi:hypothetical protein